MRGRVLFFSVVLVGIVVLSTLWWYFLAPVISKTSSVETIHCKESVATLAQEVTDPITLPPRTPPAGYELYRDETYRFSLFYPKQYLVSKHDEASDGFTVVFKDADTNEGFQVFVVSYPEDHITETRFRKDVRTGYKRDETKVSVDGVCAVEFLSRSLLLGKTHEVWAIHNGYLYELTTFRELDGLLEEVVASWKFL